MSDAEVEKWVPGNRYLNTMSHEGTYPWSWSNAGESSPVRYSALACRAQYSSYNSLSLLKLVSQLRHLVNLASKSGHASLRRTPTRPIILLFGVFDLPQTHRPADPAPFADPYNITDRDAGIACSLALQLA